MSTIKTIRTIPQQRTSMPEQAPEERVKNFFEVALGYGVEHALREADRCLDCADPRCLKGCPVSVDIPSFLRKVNEKDFRGAYDVLAKTNVLPAICGRVCPQEDQCEGMCSVGDTLEPVAIGRLERWLGDQAIALGWSKEVVAQPNGFKVGIVGSGPAGIACAADLARLGCDVTVFEALHAPGGVLRYGIPEFRLPNDVIDAEIGKLVRLGVKLECNTLVGRLFTLEQMLDEQGFHALFVATGAGLPKFMGIAGEGLNGVVSANELLTRCNLMQAGQFPDYDTPLGLGRRVAVIGAGNTAMDALRVSLRLGAEAVMCVYRRSRAECPARAEELHHAEQEGVEFHWLTNPIAILDDGHGRVRALRCQRMELGEPDASGRRRPVPVEGSEHDLEVDMVVYAIGTNANPIMGQTSRVARNRWGYIETSAELETSIAGVFAGGDIVTGSATVILAMGAGRRAARGIARYLGLALPMASDAVDKAVFHISPDTGRYLRVRARESTTVARPVVPGALAAFTSIARVRHPFPWVLVQPPIPPGALRNERDKDKLIIEGAGTDTPVCTLNQVLEAAWTTAHDLQPEAEETRRVAYMLEQTLRTLAYAADAAVYDLKELARRSADQLEVAAGDDERQRQHRRQVCAAIIAELPDAAVVGCTTSAPAQLVSHLHEQQLDRRARSVRVELAALDAELDRVQRCDFMTTEAAWTPQQMALSLGPEGAEDFDVAALSQLLTPLRSSASQPPRAARARALREALARTQVLSLPARAWVFRSCEAALQALEERLRELQALLSAMEEAHLETRAARKAAGPLRVLADQRGARALLPCCLVVLDADHLPAAEQARLLELLATDLPIKVLCTSDRLTSETLPKSLRGHSGTPGGKAALLAALSCGIGSSGQDQVYVVQAAISELASCSDELVRALDADGPALIAVYTGAQDPALSAYLSAAAACAGRIFPTFVRAPGKALSLRLNPEPAAPWPEVTFQTEDLGLQRVTVREPFTAAHLLSCWPDFASEVQMLSHLQWNESHKPLGELLCGQPTVPSGEAEVPYVTVVDQSAAWLRAAVSGSLLAYTEHVAAHWCALQRAAEPAESTNLEVAEITGVVSKPPAIQDAPETSAVVATAVDVAPKAAAESQRAAYVETARCSSCDECIKRAPGLFVYNGDKRAVLREPRAGSYREMVEAAEHCKMAVIHPGEPWDDTEPDLPALRERAAVFA